jgi:hypothetical protein
MPNGITFVEALGDLGEMTAASACSKIIPNPKYADERYLVTII